MATLWVRYRNGDTDEWRLTDTFAQDKLEDFTRDLIHSAHTKELVSFSVVPAEGAPGSGFGFLSLRTEDLIAWHVDGLVNVAKAAASWDELGGSSASPDN